MGYHVYNDEGVGGVSPSDYLEYHGEDGLAHQVGGLGMPPGRRGHIVGGDVVNVGICMEVIGIHCRVHCNTPNLRVVYQGRADSGFQSDPEVVLAVPYPSGEQHSKPKGRG